MELMACDEELQVRWISEVHLEYTTLLTFYLKDTSKYLFCAIGEAVGEVQLSPLSLRAVHVDYLPRSQASTGPTRRLIEARRLFAILPSIP